MNTTYRTRRKSTARPRIPTLKELEAQVEKFNQQAPIGTKVHVQLDDGTSRESATRSLAWVMSGHSVMVLLEGMGGGYCLDRVRIATTEKGGAL